MKKKCPGRRPKRQFPRANLQTESIASLNGTEQRTENPRPPSNSVTDFESPPLINSNPVTTTEIVSDIPFMETGEPTPSSSPIVTKKAKKISINVTNWTSRKTDHGEILMSPCGDALLRPETTNSMFSSLKQLSRRKYHKA